MREASCRNDVGPGQPRRTNAFNEGEKYWSKGKGDRAVLPNHKKGSIPQRKYPLTGRAGYKKKELGIRDGEP